MGGNGNILPRGGEGYSEGWTVVIISVQAELAYIHRDLLRYTNRT